jgi:hypothetical protein
LMSRSLKRCAFLNFWAETDQDKINLRQRRCAFPARWSNRYFK